MLLLNVVNLAPHSFLMLGVHASAQRRICCLMDSYNRWVHVCTCVCTCYYIFRKRIVTAWISTCTCFWWNSCKRQFLMQFMVYRQPFWTCPHPYLRSTTILLDTAVNSICGCTVNYERLRVSEDCNCASVSAIVYLIHNHFYICRQLHLNIPQHAIIWTQFNSNIDHLNVYLHNLFMIYSIHNASRHFWFDTCLSTTLWQMNGMGITLLCTYTYIWVFIHT